MSCYLAIVSQTGQRSGDASSATMQGRDAQCSTPRQTCRTRWERFETLKRIGAEDKQVRSGSPPNSPCRGEEGGVCRIGLSVVEVKQMSNKTKHLQQIENSLAWLETASSNELQRFALIGQLARVGFNFKSADKMAGECLFQWKERREEKRLALLPPKEIQLPEHALRLLNMAKYKWSGWLPNMRYEDFLLTEYWNLIRQAKLENAGSRCETCNTPELLQIHHLTYKHRGMEHEHHETLIVLCDGCHKKRHRK